MIFSFTSGDARLNEFLNPLYIIQAEAAFRLVEKFKHHGWFSIGKHYKLLMKDKSRWYVSKFLINALLAEMTLAQGGVNTA